jgi:hypothetical protein
MHTMGQILRNWRVLAATLFSAVLVVGAYIFARGIESPPVAQASTETALLQAIATKDSSGDGLPDWEKSLYGIPINSTTTDYFHLGMTDSEAVAKGLIVPKAIADISVATSTPTGGTLTDAFARNFFALYLSAKQANSGVDLTADQTNTLAAEAMNQLSQTFIPTADFKTTADIKIFGTGPDALRAFAVAAEAVFNRHMGTTTTSEMQSLQEVMQNGDAAAVAQLASAAQIYRNYAAGLAVLPVPQEIAADDLALINAMLLRSVADDAFTRVNTDPLSAMLALQQFSQTESAFWNVFADIGTVYAAAGVSLPTGTPGASFVNLIANSSRATP